MKYQGVKGTVDWYPDERAIFNWIRERLRQTAVSYGFQEVESPAFEYLLTSSETTEGSSFTNCASRPSGTRLPDPFENRGLGAYVFKPLRAERSSKVRMLPQGYGIWLK